MEKAFYRVNHMFTVVLAGIAHTAGAILHLTEAEFREHAHKLDPVTAEEALAAGAARATAPVTPAAEVEQPSAQATESTIQAPSVAEPATVAPEPAPPAEAPHAG